MQYVQPNQMIEVSGTVIPLAILIIESDEERAFLTEMYLQYKALIYKTAISFWGQNEAEAEDAVGASVEKMCKYCHAFQAVECNKRASYVVTLVENVCRDRLRVVVRQRAAFGDTFDEEEIEQIAGLDDVHGIVFDRIYAVDLLDSFQKLSERERDLICMRHIDMMEYDEMAAALHMKEGAVRTALSRAKQHLETLGTTLKGGEQDAPQQE